MRALVLICGLAFAILNVAAASPAGDDRIRDLERRIDRLERAGADGAWNSLILTIASGAELLAVGGFCAFWARGTGRDPWLWLCAGAVFNFMALIAVWAKHDDDKKKAAKVAEPEL